MKILVAHPSLKRVGVRDQFGQMGSLAYLKAAYGLTGAGIAKTIHEAL